MEPGTLLVSLHQARNFVGFNGGSPSTFVLVSSVDKKGGRIESKRCYTIRKESSPQWEDQLIFEVDANVEQLELAVYDREGIIVDELIGNTTLPHHRVSPTNPMSEVWIPISPAGRLASFAIAHNSTAAAAPVNAEVCLSLAYIDGDTRASVEAVQKAKIDARHRRKEMKKLFNIDEEYLFDFSCSMDRGTIPRLGRAYVTSTRLLFNSTFKQKIVALADIRSIEKYKTALLANQGVTLFLKSGRKLQLKNFKHRKSFVSALQVQVQALGLPSIPTVERGSSDEHANTGEGGGGDSEEDTDSSAAVMASTPSPAPSSFSLALSTGSASPTFSASGSPHLFHTPPASGGSTGGGNGSGVNNYYYYSHINLKDSNANNEATSSVGGTSTTQLSVVVTATPSPPNSMKRSNSTKLRESSSVATTSAVSSASASASASLLAASAANLEGSSSATAAAGIIGEKKDKEPHRRTPSTTLTSIVRSVSDKLRNISTSSSSITHAKSDTLPAPTPEAFVILQSSAHTSPSLSNSPPASSSVPLGASAMITSHNNLAASSSTTSQLSASTTIKSKEKSGIFGAPPSFLKDLSLPFHLPGSKKKQHQSQTSNSETPQDATLSESSSDSEEEDLSDREREQSRRLKYYLMHGEVPAGSGEEESELEASKQFAKSPQAKRAMLRTAHPLPRSIGSSKDDDASVTEMQSAASGSDTEKRNSGNTQTRGETGPSPINPHSMRLHFPHESTDKDSSSKTDTPVISTAAHISESPSTSDGDVYVSPRSEPLPIHATVSIPIAKSGSSSYIASVPNGHEMTVGSAPAGPLSSIAAHMGSSSTSITSTSSAIYSATSHRNSPPSLPVIYHNEANRQFPALIPPRRTGSPSLHASAPPPSSKILEDSDRSEDAEAMSPRTPFDSKALHSSTTSTPSRTPRHAPHSSATGPLVDVQVSTTTANALHHTHGDLPAPHQQQQQHHHHRGSSHHKEQHHAHHQHSQSLATPDVLADSVSESIAGSADQSEMSPIRARRGSTSSLGPGSSKKRSKTGSKIESASGERRKRRDSGTYSPPTSGRSSGGSSRRSSKEMRRGAGSVKQLLRAFFLQKQLTKLSLKTAVFSFVLAFAIMMRITGSTMLTSKAMMRSVTFGEIVACAVAASAGSVLAQAIAFFLTEHDRCRIARISNVYSNHIWKDHLVPLILLVVGHLTVVVAGFIVFILACVSGYQGALPPVLRVRACILYVIFSSIGCHLIAKRQESAEN